jgi:hypothetical protein
MAMTSQTLFLIKRAVSSNSVWAIAGLNQLLPCKHPLREITASKVDARIRSIFKKAPRFVSKILKEGLTVSELSATERGKLQRFDLVLQSTKYNL